MEPLDQFAELGGRVGAVPGATATAIGFVLGAVIGSFLAALLVRWPQGRSVLRGRSHCDRCGSALGLVDLVPILSWIWLRGRCRRCGGSIDRRHLALEIGAALIGLTAIFAHPLPLALFTAILGWWLFLLAALDAEYQWLPDRLTLPLLLAGLAGLVALLLKRLRGGEVRATDRLPLGTLMALAAWPIWLLSAG